MTITEELTYSTLLIKCQNEKEAWTGTGFIINLCFNSSAKTCIPVIITNKHVVRGATKISFEFCEMLDGKPNDQSVLTIIAENCNWIFHPDENIDLCCFPIASILRHCQDMKLNIFYIPIDARIIPNDEIIQKARALENVVMIGYPNGISDMYNHKPVIRRGITATHIKKDYQGNKTFLVDIACFPGSSGSPIFILNEGAYLDDSNNLCAGTKLLLIGILARGPQFTAEGNIVFKEIANIPKTITNIPMNLGEAFKASLLLDFEKILDQKNDDKA